MTSQIAKLKSRLRGLRKRFLRFSKASFFLSGLVFGNALAEYSFLGFLIVYIQYKSNGDNLRYDAVVSTAKDCFSAFLASFLAYTTHQRIRPLIMILVNHAIFIAGMLILLFHQSPIDGIFYLGLALLSVNLSAEQYMMEFLTDQLVVNELEQGINDAKKTNCQIDAWRFIARLAGAIIGGVLISNSSRSKQLYIPAIFVGIGCILCYSYSLCYKVSSGDHQEERHELRPLLKFLPLWSPFLIYYVVDAAGSTFFGYEEAYLYIIQKASGIVVSGLIGFVITKFCSKVNQQEQQCIRRAKVTFGMLVCFLLCINTWHAMAKEKSWMHILQYILLGIMKAMVQEMLGEYFFEKVTDKSLHHLEFTFNSFVEGMGRLLAVVCILVFRNWIGENVQNSHLDKYFRTLAFMSLCALLMFVYLSNTCYWTKEAEDHDNHLEKLEEGRRSCSSESKCYSPRSSSVSQSTVYFSSDESISASSEEAAVTNLESAEPSANRNRWSIVRRNLIRRRETRRV